MLLDARGIAAFDRATGKKLWETFIPQNGVEYVHYKNGFASATPTTSTSGMPA